MKILFIAEFFPASLDLIFSGGVESYNYYLIKELSKKHQIIVITRNSSLSPKQEIKIKNVKIVRLGKKTSKIDTSLSTIPARLGFFFYALVRGLKEEFDIVQGNNFITHPIAFMIGMIKKKPTVAWYPDVFIGKWIDLFGFTSGLIGELSERITLSLPWSKVIALSESTKSKLIGKGVNQDKISTIYAGIDLNDFSKIRSKKNKKFTIICISRLVSYKGVDVLINAAKILKEKNLDFSVQIIGQGPQQKKLERVVDEFNLTNEFSFESQLTRKELIKRLKSSSLLCLPSYEEGFGLVLLEAAAAGIPYVASNLTVLKEVTKNGLGGLFFKTGNSDDLASKITLLVKDKKLLIDKIRETKFLSKLYSWSQITNQFEKEYEKLFKEKIKILMLNDAWFPHVGGGQVHTWELSKKLADLSCEITIITRNLGEWSYSYPTVRVRRVGFIKTFSNFFGRLEYLILALFYCLTEDYQILHAHAFSPGLITPIVKFFRNKLIVFTVHGQGVKIAGLGIGSKFLEDLIFYKIGYDLEITVARSTLKQKPMAKKVVVIPNGVDINKFSKFKRFRKKIHNLAYVGRISYEKGVDLLIKAYKNLLRNRRFNLLIVGEGPEKDKIVKMSKGLPIRFYETVTGDKLLSILSKVDLLVIPSRSEGLPLILFESWAMGLPVLATRVGDLHYYIKDGRNGFLANVDSDSLKENINKATKIRSLESISRRGLKDVQNYNWERVGKLTYQNYQKLLRSYEKS